MHFKKSLIFLNESLRCSLICMFGVGFLVHMILYADVYMHIHIYAKKKVRVMVDFFATKL